MANHEDYLDALTSFASDASKEIPPILEQYLGGVAKNGETLFQWPLLKPLIVGKMEQVIEELQRGLSSENITSRPNVENVRFDVMRTRIMDAVQKFTGAPFTIQRLCELLVDPRRHYKRSDKFMRGLEKNVLVVSTVDPFGRKVVSEAGNKHLVNGMDNGIPMFSRDSGLGSNLPPVPDWVTTTATTTSRPQDSTEKVDTQETGLTSNGVSGGLVNPVFGDHGDQTPAVHAEEVVETAVSLETSEACPEATGAGEALAEEEEEEDMGTEDTNASTSSSSSSSSEDLSAPDLGEGSTPPRAPLSTITSSSPNVSDSRPWAAIAAEGENKQEDQTMDLEPHEPLPEPSESQDAKLTDSQSLPSSLVKCQSPIDSSASTSSHTGPPVDSGVEASESQFSEQNSEDMSEDLPATTETPQGGGQDISSSSSSSSLPNISASDSESDISPLYADGSGDKQQFQEEKMHDGQERRDDTDSAAEPVPSAVVVTSTETGTLPLSEQMYNRDITSSDLHQQAEASGEPQAKHRRLSDDSEPSSAPSISNHKDSEPSSSSFECLDREASSTEESWQATTVENGTADTTAFVTSYSSPPTKTALVSTTDNPAGLQSLETSDVEKHMSHAEFGGGDGDMPQSTLREDRTDPDCDDLKTSLNSSCQVEEGIKDQISSNTTQTNLASQSAPSNDGSHEPMDQD